MPRRGKLFVSMVMLWFEVCCVDGKSYGDCVEDKSKSWVEIIKMESNLNNVLLKI